MWYNLGLYKIIGVDMKKILFFLVVSTLSLVAFETTNIQLLYGENFKGDSFVYDTEDGKKTKFPNEDSVVAVLEYGATEIIFTGDLESKTEKKIIAMGHDIRADVLKVPHHGSKTGLEDEFLNLISFHQNQ